MPTNTQTDTFDETARTETMPRLARPIQRDIGGPKPVRAADAATLARIAMADARGERDRVLDTVVDRLAAAIAEPRPALRLTAADAPRRTTPRRHPGSRGIAR